MALLVSIIFHKSNHTKSHDVAPLLLDPGVQRTICIIKIAYMFSYLQYKVKDSQDYRSFEDGTWHCSTLVR